MAELTALSLALAELNKKGVAEMVEEKLRANANPIDIVRELGEGMTEVGRRFAAEEYFLSELMYSSYIMKGIVERLESLMGKVDIEPDRSSKAAVVIGTVKRDIHDIGKNIVLTLLGCAGFRVIDLGVDVPAERFVEKLEESSARVLGLSAMLTTTVHEMKNVVDAVVAAGLRGQVTIIIGGQPADERVRQYAGADYYALDAPKLVEICKQVYAES